MEELRRVLKQSDTVLFIGSGISRWSGLPSWPGLIDQLASYLDRNGIDSSLVRAEASHGDLLQAASYGFDKLTLQQIGDFIRTACRYGKARPNEEIHKPLVSLGPRCFITTNYDDLLEQSLRLWQSERFYPHSVTNKHLTEMAEVVHARATDFVFKPHGDAGDSDSIILTREQYRELLPQGERHATLDSLKTLLVSRPIVYVGFGLKDPDFSYIRDILFNTYRGATRDHFAIIPDVTQAEIDYWRRQYGIHLIGYSTKKNSAGISDHSQLPALLKELSKPQEPPKADKSFKPDSPETLLSLARYAAKLEQVPKAATELPLRVRSRKRQAPNQYSFDKNDFKLVDAFLLEGPDKAVLIGLPGAGKTYALKQAAGKLAGDLHAKCLSHVEPEEATIPIYADLKLYRGNLYNLVNESLPTQLPFEHLVDAFPVKIFLDSFNEMPREFWEQTSYESDFASFFELAGKASIVIGSRTADGLERFNFPAYGLDVIDPKTVKAQLANFGINITGRFEDEISELLAKPFFFQMVATGAVNLPPEPHPRDLYSSYFEKLERAFEGKFGASLELSRVLSEVAYQAIDRGDEAFSLAILQEALAYEAANGLSVAPKEVVNWLVYRSVLTPYSGARISFVHQSITEYLAASELAKRYKSAPQLLREKIAFTRWDQAILFTLSLFSDTEADAVLRSITGVDLSFALSATKYVEHNRESIIESLLRKVPDAASAAIPYDLTLSNALASVPVSAAHETELRNIVALGDAIGGAAVILLADLIGTAIKPELFQLLVDRRGDYNFCANGVAVALKQWMDDQDANLLKSIVASLESEFRPGHEHGIHGFISAAADLLSSLDPGVVRTVFAEDASPLSIEILCDSLQDRHSSAGLQLCCDLLLQGVERAATSLYFITEFAKTEDEVEWEIVTTQHIEKLIAIGFAPNGDSWGIQALQSLCKRRPALAATVNLIAERYTGLHQAVLLNAANLDNVEPIFSELERLSTRSVSDQEWEQVTLIGKVRNLDWTGREDLFSKLIQLNNTTLSREILNYNVVDADSSIGTVDPGSISRLASWLAAEEDEFVLRERIARLCCHHTTDEWKRQLLEEFNNPVSAHRDVLQHLLSARADLTTDDFSHEAVSFLLSELSKPQRFDFYLTCLLGSTATENFIAERLLPLTESNEEILAKNLKTVLSQAGKRHGRRYIH